MKLQNQPDASACFFCYLNWSSSISFDISRNQTLSDMLLTASDDDMEDTDVATITMCPEKQEQVDLSHFIAENKDSGGKKKSLLVLMIN